MSAEKEYVKTLGQQTGYIPVWIPGTKISVGTIGRMKRRTFIPVSSLHTQDVPFEIEEGDEEVNIIYSSAGGVDFQLKAQGEVLRAAPSIPQGSAGVVVSFNKGNTVASSAVGCRTHRVKDIPALEAAIFDLYDRYQWDRDLVVVTHTVVASSATVLLAQDGGAKVELLAGADVGAPGAPINLANIGANVSLAASFNMETAFVGERGMTPLFRASKVKGWLFPGVKQIDVKRLTEPVPEDEPVTPPRRGAERPETSILEDVVL